MLKQLSQPIKPMEAADTTEETMDLEAAEDVFTNFEETDEDFMEAVYPLV